MFSGTKKWNEGTFAKTALLRNRFVSSRNLFLFFWGAAKEVRQKEFDLRPFNPPRGVLGPFGPKVGNGVENEFPGPSGPGAQKVKNGLEKKSKKWKLQLFLKFFDFFSALFLTFGAPGPEGPGNTFSTPFPTLGPKGPVLVTFRSLFLTLLSLFSSLFCQTPFAG